MFLQDKPIIELVQEIANYKQTKCSKIKLIYGETVLSLLKTPEEYSLDITTIVGWHTTLLITFFNAFS